MIKAVIFDMDGLLIDSEPLWKEAEVKILNKVGIPLTPEKAKETMGLRENEVIEYWLLKYPQENVSEQKILSDVIDEVTRLIIARAEMMEGVNEVIELFASQNIPMAVASSSEVSIIDAALGKIMIKDKMKVICSAEHEKFGKPHPGVYITAAEKLGISPLECLVFEDSPNGLLAAKSAKMKCVVVPDSSLIGDKRFGIADLSFNSLKDFTLEHLMSFNK